MADPGAGGGLEAALQAAQSADAGQRRAAEAHLAALRESSRPGFLVALAGELARAGAPAHVRQLAGLVLKNEFSAKTEARRVSGPAPAPPRAPARAEERPGAMPPRPCPVAGAPTAPFPSTPSAPGPRRCPEQRGSSPAQAPRVCWAGLLFGGGGGRIGVRDEGVAPRGSSRGGVPPATHRY